MHLCMHTMVILCEPSNPRWQCNASSDVLDGWQWGCVTTGRPWLSATPTMTIDWHLMLCWCCSGLSVQLGGISICVVVGAAGYG